MEEKQNRPLWRKYMHNPFLLLVLNAILVGLLTLIPLWQLMIIPCLISGGLAKKGSTAFLVGSLGVILGWGAYLLITLLQNGSGILANYFTLLLFGNYQAGWMLVFASLLVGGVIGGLSSYLGFFGSKYRRD